MKKIFLAGSSGSIGKNSLEVIKNNPELFEVSVLSVNSNTELLLKQIKEFRPRSVVVTNPEAYSAIRQNKYECQVFCGSEALIRVAAEEDYDVFLGAIVGFAGLEAAYEAVKRGKKVALANKETLVAAGDLVKKTAKNTGCQIIPVDSEHSAIFQCLVGEDRKSLEKIILTASGGPFRGFTRNQMQSVSVEQALNHPNWNMGNKITIDSATLMNKGLEVIEAYWLFDLELNQIDVVVHPQSIIHSMVQFNDGSIKAQLGLPDMKLPIQYALGFPSRLKNKFERVDFPKLNSMSFFEPDYENFGCLKLAFEAIKQKGNASCILNAANEEAVRLFLDKKIKFVDIPAIIDKVLQTFDISNYNSIEELIETDKLARLKVKDLLRSFNS